MNESPREPAREAAQNADGKIAFSIASKIFSMHAAAGKSYPKSAKSLRYGMR